MVHDKGYSDEDMADVTDNPEWTVADFARARPFADVFPDLAESLKGGTTLVRAAAPLHLTVTLHGDLAAYYASFGDQAEARLDADLWKVAGIET